MAAPTAPADTGAEIPEGFFDEIASLLETESAEEIADVVISVCTHRGILHPELDEDLADELRTEQVREVFALVDAVTVAVSNGTLVPRRIAVSEEMDPMLARLWFGFVEDAVDLAAADAVAQMVETGEAGDQLQQ
jgi:hypothetical protein